MIFQDEKWIEALAALPAAHRAVFAASVSERQFPNYEAFVAEEGCGDPVSLREGLDVVWAAIESGTLDEGYASNLMDRVEDAAPSSEDFSGMFASLAQNAAAAVYHTLECCITGDPKSALLAATDAGEAIHYYLAEVAGVCFYGRFLPKDETDADTRAQGDYAERWRDASPLMLAEILAQEEDLTALRSAPSLTTALLREVRERSQKGGIQPFQRGLVKRENIPANPRPVPPPK